MDTKTNPLVFVAACIGKEPFTSPRVANKILRRWRRAGRPGTGGLYVYRCPSCAAFHIGNAAKSRHNSHASGRRARRGLEVEEMV
jgi:hypothetical protein